MFEAVFLKSSFDLDIGANYTNSDLAIAIAGPASGTSQQISSTKLKFDSVSSLAPEINLGYMHSLGDSHTVFGEVGGYSGKISDGSTSVNEYSLNDNSNVSTQSFPDSNSEKNNEIHYKLGVKSRWFGKPGHYNSVYIGQSKTKLNNRFKSDKVINTTNTTNSQLKVESNYAAEIQTRKIGLTTEHQLPVGVVSAGYEIGDSDYDASANWNLRSDLKKNNSFSHSAEGGERTLSLSYTAPVSKSVDLTVSYQQTNYNLKNAFEQSNYDNGSTKIGKLDGVKFNSYSVKTTVSIRF